MSVLHGVQDQILSVKILREDTNVCVLLASFIPTLLIDVNVSYLKCSLCKAIKIQKSLKKKVISCIFKLKKLNIKFTKL